MGYFRDAANFNWRADLVIDRRKLIFSNIFIYFKNNCKTKVADVSERMSIVWMKVQRTYNYSQPGSVLQQLCQRREKEGSAFQSNFPLSFFACDFRLLTWCLCASLTALD